MVRRIGFILVDPPWASRRGDLRPRATVGCENTLEPSEVDSGFGLEGSQTDDEVEGIQDDVGCAIAIWGKSGRLLVDMSGIQDSPRTIGKKNGRSPIENNARSA